MRCFVIALGLHIALLVGMVAVKIAVVVQKDYPHILPDF
jgi:hypothetical protein